jgi:hypothetical protein
VAEYSGFAAPKALVLATQFIKTPDIGHAAEVGLESV